MNYKNRFVSYLASLGYQQKTIFTKGRRIAYFERWIAPKSIVESYVTDIKSYYKSLQETKAGYQIKTINKYMTDLDQFYSWCCLCGYISTHPFGNLKLIKSKATESRKPVNKEIIKQLYKACETPQEKMLLLFAYGCGLRALELQQLKVKDIETGKALLVVQSGKLNKRRYIPLKNSHLGLIKQFIVNEALSPNDYFFSFETLTEGFIKKPAYNTTESCLNNNLATIKTTVNQQISQYLLRKLLKGLQKRIGLQKPWFSLHHLRHSIASHLVEKGVDIRLVQKFLGHEKLETTQNYVTLGQVESGK